MRRASDLPAPMPIAELAECCGQLRWTGIAFEQAGTDFTEACENCPLLIQHRRDRVLQTARAE